MNTDVGWIFYYVFVVICICRLKQCFKCLGFKVLVIKRKKSVWQMDRQGLQNLSEWINWTFPSLRAVRVWGQQITADVQAAVAAAQGTGSASFTSIWAVGGVSLLNRWTVHFAQWQYNTNLLLYTLSKWNRMKMINYFNYAFCFDHWFYFQFKSKEKSTSVASN